MRNIPALVYLTVLMCCMLAYSTCVAGTAPRWMKQMHTRPVLNAMMHDSLGVSCDDSVIVVWKVATGEVLRTFAASGGYYSQAYLSGDLKSLIVVFIPADYRQGRVLWLDIDSGVRTDSMDLPTRTPAYEVVVSSDLSSDASQLLVVLSRPKVNNQYRCDVFIIQLSSKTTDTVEVDVNYYPRRFECRDKKVNAYDLFSSIGGSTWCTSGLYRCNGAQFIDYPVSGQSTRIFENGKQIIRWGDQDSYVLGRDINGQGAKGDLHIFDICQQKATEVLDSTLSFEFAWSPLQLGRVVAFSRKGRIGFWTLDSATVHAVNCDLLRAPDTIKVDSLFQLQILRLPLTRNGVLYTKSEDGTVVPTSLYSLHDTSTTTLEVGEMIGADISWVPFVLPPILPSHSQGTFARMLAIGREYLAGIDVIDDNSILIASSDGSTFFVDSTLQCRQGLLLSRGTIAVRYNDKNTIDRLTTTRDTYTDGHHYASINRTTVAERVRIQDGSTFHTSSQLLQYSFSIRDYEAYSEYFNIVDDESSQKLSYAFAHSYLNRKDGGIWLGKPSDTLLYSKMFSDDYWQTTTSDQGALAVGGAVNKSGTLALVRYLSLMSDTQRISVVTHTRGEPSICLKGYRGTYMMFVSDNVAIVDSAIISADPVEILQRTTISGPFAHTVEGDGGIAWNAGNFYWINGAGKIVDSIPGPEYRPAYIAELRPGSIVCGWGGAIQLYQKHIDPQLGVTNDVRSERRVTVTISPQPAQGIVTIRTSMPLTEKGVLISVVDVTGRQVAVLERDASEYHTLDVSTLGIAPGVYTLVFTNGRSTANTTFSVVR